MVYVDIPIVAAGDESCWREIIEQAYGVHWRIQEVSRSDLAGSTLRVTYAGRAMPAAVVDAIRAISTEICTSHRRIPVEVAFSHRDGQPPRGGDAVRQLVEQGAVRLTEDGGLQASGVFRRLMAGLQQELRRYAHGLGAEEYEFPSLLPLDVAERCGILDNQPQHVHFVAGLQHTIDGVRESLADLTRTGGNGAWRKHLARPRLILAPAVCYHYWCDRPWRGEAPLELGTATGRCYRFEAPGLVGLDRLREFSMWEVFAVGGPDDTRALRARWLEYLHDLLVRLDVAGRVATASDPFFADVYARKRMFQVNMRLKHELQLWLPPKGERIAVASVNDHREFFTRAFGIAGDAGRPLHSCCMAVGLERFTLAALSQHGLLPAQWPPGLASLVGG